MYILLSKANNVLYMEGRRDLQTKKALPQGPPKIGAPGILLLVLNFQFDYQRLEKKKTK